jgi:hypothetical protein
MVKSQTEQIDLGAYYTPPATVAHILAVIGSDRIHQAGKIIEPSGGDGIFVQGLLEAGANPSCIEVWDIDKDTELSIEQLNVAWSLGDTLKRDITPGLFDVVVGNPPYLNKRSAYIRENKGWLTKKFKEVGASETYVMFTYACAKGLQEGGRLGFVLSDTFLSLGTHRRFRDWLLENTKIVEISLAPARLFNVAVSTVILVVERCSDARSRDENTVRYFDRVPDETHYGDAAYLHEIRQDDLRLTPNHAFASVDPALLKLFATCPSLMSAGLDGHIGMHTRNNERYLVPADGSTAQAAAVASGDLMPYLKTGGIIDYWSPVREYIRWDATSRKAYVIPRTHYFGQQGVAISGISARLSARLLEAGCYWDTNKVMGFRNDTGLSDATVVGLLNSRLYNYLAKGVLNTTASIQIDDLRRLPLIPMLIEQIERVHQLVIGIVSRLRSGRGATKNAEARAEIDEIVFAAANIDSDLRRRIDDYWLSTESKRRSKST